MFHPQGRYHNAKRLLNRRPPAQDAFGTRRTVRAAEPAKVRLRCQGPQAHVFRAADRMRCPMCQHPTVIVGDVK